MYEPIHLQPSSATANEQEGTHDASATANGEDAAHDATANGRQHPGDPKGYTEFLNPDQEQQAIKTESKTGKHVDENIGVDKAAADKAAADKAAVDKAAADKATKGAAFAIVGPRAWWLQLRQSQHGHAFIRDTMRQLLLSLAAVHDANVSHRDVKPENLLMSGEPKGHARAGQQLHLRLIDFGSALDKYSLGVMYGMQGPGGGELTLEYAPPEVLFSSR